MRPLASLEAVVGNSVRMVCDCRVAKAQVSVAIACGVMTSDWVPAVHGIEKTPLGRLKIGQGVNSLP